VFHGFALSAVCKLTAVFLDKGEFVFVGLASNRKGIPPKGKQFSSIYPRSRCFTIIEYSESSMTSIFSHIAQK
jgi:hypothetical protein